MNADLSRRAAVAMQNAPLTPAERTKFAMAVEQADSFEAMPEWAQKVLTGLERATPMSQEEVGAIIARRTAAKGIADQLG